MFKSLSLTNFRRHTDLTLTFEPGVNGLRGANEQGKSTIYEAILYALGGARAPPQSISEVVTWGLPPTALKVALELQLGGVDYTITRSPAGAELNSQGLKVTGQTEVTAYVENLIGLPISTAQQIMIVKQNNIQGVLTTGATSLIEKLAKADLVDRLIVGVQHELPCGNTRLVESRIAQLDRELGVEIAVPDWGQFDQAVDLAKAELAEAESTLGEELAGFQAIVEQAEEAKAVIAKAALQSQELRRLLNKVNDLKTQAANKPVAPVVDVESLRQAHQRQQDRLKIQAAWDVYQQSQTIWTKQPEAVAELQSYLSIYQGKVRAADSAISAAKVGLADSKARLVPAGECNFCGKDLTTVAEVVAHNEALNQLIAEHTRTIEVHKLQKTEAEANIERVEQGLRAYTRLTKCLQYPDYIAFQEGVLSTPSWKGEPVTDTPDTRNYPALIKQAESAIQQYHRAMAVWQANCDELTLLSAELDRPRPTFDLEAAQSAVAAVTAAQSKQTALTRKVGDLELQVSRALQAKVLAQSAYDAQLSARAVRESDREGALSELATLRKNNTLIEKLRTIRPQVSKRLWALVLGSVSSHFSRLRGTPSVVTLEDGEFLIDGRSYKSYSGSTQDVLGLAIRITAQRTFLPNANFIILDEPAAGCDETREATLLATLASAEYDQVLIVSHSNLLDSFADNLIRI